MQAWSDVVFYSADGLRLYARDYPGLAPSTGAPVLCLHGLTRNSRDFDDLAPRIAALGRRVIVPDVRGRGRSDRDPQPQRYAPPTYAGDVLALMAHLRIDGAVVVGTSMGGIIAMLLAMGAPNLLKACVLNDVGPRLNGRGLARIAGYVGKTESVASWDEAVQTIRAIAESAYPGRDEAFWRAFAARTCKELPDGRIGFDYDPAIALAFAAGAPPEGVEMDSLFVALRDIPVLMMHGVLSDLLTTAELEAARVLKPDVRIVEVPATGHAPFLTEPEAWEALLMFLAEVP